MDFVYFPLFNFLPILLGLPQCQMALLHYAGLLETVDLLGVEIQKGFSHAGHMRTGMHCGFSKTCNKVAPSEEQKTVVVVIILEASVRHGSDSCSDSVVEQFLQVRTAFCNTLWMCDDCVSLLVLFF